MALPFVKARNFYRGRKRAARLIVIHDMELLQGPSTAEACARFFQNQSPTKAPRSSAHFCCDQDSIVQSVSVGDTAWAAPNANADGVHFELAGKARQSTREWTAKANDEMLTWAACEAALVFGLLRFFGVPIEVRRLTPAEIRAGKAGFCGHNDVTAAFGTRGGHTDPGPNFPWDVFLGKVRWWVGTFDAQGWPAPNYR